MIDIKKFKKINFGKKDSKEMNRKNFKLTLVVLLLTVVEFQMLLNYLQQKNQNFNKDPNLQRLYHLQANQSQTKMEFL